MEENRGYVHIYTGNGKGKTTAALGLAIRMVGTGQKVFLAQFVKSMQYAEIRTIDKYIPFIEHKQYGFDCFIEREPDKKDVQAAQKGLEEVKEILKLKQYKLIILDELNIAIYYKLLDVNEVVEVVKSKPDETELVITGRYAPKELLELANLITEMKEEKHYYEQGVLSREGVEF